MGLPNINRRKTMELLCMVVGCERTALYRSVDSTRGYCRTHKAIAMLEQERRTRGRVRHIAWLDDHPNPLDEPWKLPDVE